MEMDNGMTASQDTGLSNSVLTSDQGLTSGNAPSVHEPAHQADTRAQRTFSQDEVNEFVKRAKADVRRVQQEQPDYARQRQGSTVQPDQYGSATVGDDHVKRIVSDSIREMREQWAAENQQRLNTDQANKVINTFWSKVNPAKEKYSDFDKVTSNIGLQSFPNTVQLLADYVDNSGDVLYALGKDMGKLATIESWCEKYPQVAIQEVQKLAQSIKDNEVASRTRLPNEPLSQLQVKNVGMGNGTSASVRDLRALYKNKGR